jgi:hypothetical protein
MLVVGIEVIDRRPFHATSEVPLDAIHEPAHVAREIELARVLGRHDESKLMRFARARLLEGLTLHGPVWAVEHAFRSVLVDAVTLDIPKVQSCRLRSARGEAYDVRLDDDAPSIWTVRASAGPVRLGGLTRPAT